MEFCFDSRLSWLNVADDTDDPRSEVKEGVFDNKLEAVKVEKLLERLEKGPVLICVLVVRGVFGTLGGSGLLMANERTLSTPPEFLTRVTKHVKLSMKYFRSFFIVLSKLLYSCLVSHHLAMTLSTYRTSQKSLFKRCAYIAAKEYDLI